MTIQRKIPVTVSFPDQDLEALEDWRKGHKIIPSRAEAARIMVAHGLKALAQGMPLDNS